MFFNFCDANEATVGMLDELVEELGYKSTERIAIYLLLPRMQINEHGLKLIAKNSDRNCIITMVREGHRFLMFYLDHEESMRGGNCDLDDLVLNPIAHLPIVISPVKMNKYTVESRQEGARRSARATR